MSESQSNTAWDRRLALFLAISTPATLYFCLPLFEQRLSTPFWWPLLATLPFWCWLLRRFSRGGFCGSRTTVGISLLWLITLIVALVRDSAWISMLSAWLLATAAGSALRSSKGEKGPLVLGLPWLLLAGLPPSLDGPLRTGLLERITQRLLVTGVASGHTGWREGTQLFSDVSSIDVQSVFASPLCLSLWLVLAWLLMIWQRASLVQIALILAITVCCSLAAMTGAVWLSTFSPLAGILSASLGFFTVAELLVALSGWPLIYSVRSMVKGLTAPILSRNDKTVRTNVFVQRWNRHVGGLNERPSVNPTADAAEPAPLNTAQIPAFFMELLQSRPIDRIAFGILPATLIGGLALWNSSTATWKPAAALAASQSLAAARDAKDSAREEACLKTLISLEPANLEHSLQLALLLWNQNRRDECRTVINRITPDGQPGYPAARMWLVKNSFTQDPLIALTRAQQISQLQQIVAVDATNAEACGLLGKLYFAQEEFLLAESQFETAARLDPAWRTEILKMYRQRLQFPPDISPFLEYRDELLRQLKAAPKNPKTRLRLTELEFLLGNTAQALEILKSSSIAPTDPELQQLEIELRIAIVSQIILSGDFIIRDLVLPELTQALRLAPERTTLLAVAVECHAALGARFDAETLELLHKHWSPKDNEAPDQRRSYALVMLLKEQPEAVVEILAADPKRKAVHNLALTQALQQLNRHDEAKQIATEFADQLGSLDSPQKTGQAIQLLTQAGLFTDARQRCNPIPDADIRRQTLNSISLLEFDALAHYPGQFAPTKTAWNVPDSFTPEIAATLLAGPLTAPGLDLRLLHRLYALRHASPRLADFANSRIQLILNKSGNPSTLLSTVGSSAAVEERWQDALECFDKALQTAQARNISLINNLAIAIIRSGNEQRYQEALRLVEEALQATPERTELLATRGEVFLALKRWPQAEADLEAVLNRIPNHPDASRLLPLAKQRRPQ